MFSHRLLATLALIIVYSIYIGQIVQASAVSLVMCMYDRLRGVACIRQCPYPALTSRWNVKYGE